MIASTVEIGPVSQQEQQICHVYAHLFQKRLLEVGFSPMLLCHDTTALEFAVRRLMILCTTDIRIKISLLEDERQCTHVPGDHPAPKSHVCPGAGQLLDQHANIVENMVKLLDRIFDISANIATEVPFPVVRVILEHMLVFLRVFPRQQTQLRKCLLLDTRLVKSGFQNLISFIDYNLSSVYFADIPTLLPIVTGVIEALTDKNEILQTAKSFTVNSGNVNSVVVESSHPYHAAECERKIIEFDKRVQVMSVDFDSRCVLAQAEDFVRFYVSTSETNSSKTDEKTSANISQVLGNNEEIMGGWRFFTKCAFGKWPKGVLLIPGNRLLIELNTASIYLKNIDLNDMSKFFGYKCNITGHLEVNENLFISLENGLTRIASQCISLLLTPSCRKQTKKKLQTTQPLTFASIPIGINIELKKAYFDAERKRGTSNGGTCISSQPLAPDANGTRSFVITLTEHNNCNRQGSLGCGIMEEPDFSKKNLPQSAGSCSNAYYINGKSAFIGNTRKKDYAAIDTLSTGDKIKIVLSSAGELSFFYNDVDKGIAFTGLSVSTKKFYAFVDLNGAAISANINGLGRCKYIYIYIYIYILVY